MKTNPLTRLALFLSLTLASLTAFAQADKYKAGDKIEYLESPLNDLWEPGVYMYATPDGKQPIIRKKPNEFYKDGAQTAYSWERIRPFNPGVKPTPPAPAPPKANLPPVSEGRQLPVRPMIVTPPAPLPTLPNAGAPPQRSTPGPNQTIREIPGRPLHGALMSKEEVLNFLQTRLGDQPFAHPQREQIKKELAEMIKQRGVNFRYETLSDFSNQLGKLGAHSDIIFPLQANYGPPTKEPWLMGKWNLSKIGATVDYKGNDGYIYRQGEIGVKDVGSVIISADGKYTWNIDVPRGVAQGTWRKATAAEMPYQGGDAVVLLKAKGGVDWIIHQDRVTELKGDWVNITQLDSRQIREGGFREGKGK